MTGYLPVVSVAGLLAADTSSEQLPSDALLQIFFFFFFLGGRAIHYTYMDMQRKKPQVSNGRPSTAEAASYPHYLGRGKHKSLQRGNMSGTCSSPARLQPQSLIGSAAFGKL